MRWLRSGWVPAILVYLVGAVLLRNTGNVAARDILAFTAWMVWAHTLPGTVVWRAIDWRGRRGSGPATGRPLLEDLVLGSVFGLILSVPAYLVAVMIGTPRLVLLWPLLVIVPAALTSSGRALLVRRQAEPTPAWWSWSLAAVMLYVIAYSAQTAWSPLALSPASLDAPHIDEPYHLALISEFLNHFPAEVPFVDGTPLRYHWLFYPFAAAGSWGTGIEPVVLLRLVAPAGLSALLVLGVAVTAARVSGHRWAALGAAMVLCMLSPLDVMPWTSGEHPWLNTAWIFYRSPTQTLANALCPLLIVLVVGVLRGAALRPRHWLATFVVMLAVAGAKSAMLPLFVAALCGTAVLMLVIRRRIPWAVVGLGALSVGVFGLATLVFYGTGSRAMTLVPFQVIDGQALRLQLMEPGHPASTSVRGALTLVFLVCVAAPVAGGIGLFVRGGWRRPVPWVLLGTWVSGIGVYLCFHHPALGQAYFYRSGAVAMAVLSGVGWARAAGTMTRRTAFLVVASLAAGLMWAFAVSRITSAPKPNGEVARSETAQLAASFGVPLALALAGLLVGVVAAWLLTRSWSSRTSLPLLAGISFVLGMCLIAPLADLTDRDQGPGQVQVRRVSPGGIQAAIWLRDHSDPDDLVATNAHTPEPATHPGDHRQFWISAYTERRVLVEGWAYIPPESVGLPSTRATNRVPGPQKFWHQERLELNDEVFSDPTRADTEELVRRYGVDWLFVDKRRKPDLDGLRKFATERYRAGDYVVFEIGDGPSS